MATKTRSDLPEGPPAIIFKGTVKKIKSATMKEVPISDRTAVVRVDQVIEAPRTFAHCGGQDITVELAGKKKVSVGEQFIFHANSWIFGDSVAVRAVTQERVTKEHLALMRPGGEPTEQRKNRQLQKRLNAADLVVSGKVAAVTIPPEPVPSTRGAGAPRKPVSEHDPKWRQAVIVVDQTHKGKHDSKQVNVLFPASTDVRWYKAPKFQVGQKGVFVLHKTKIKTDEHHELRGLAPRGAAGEAEVYTALDPADAHPLKQQAVIKEMIRP